MRRERKRSMIKIIVGLFVIAVYVITISLCKVSSKDDKLREREELKDDIDEIIDEDIESEF